MQYRFFGGDCGKAVELFIAGVNLFETLINNSLGSYFAVFDSGGEGRCV
jgi:hypothetical protein